MIKEKVGNFSVFYLKCFISLKYQSEKIELAGLQASRAATRERNSQSCGYYHSVLPSYMFP
jgi:hypothetical protein